MYSSGDARRLARRAALPPAAAPRPSGGAGHRLRGARDAGAPHCPAVPLSLPLLLPLLLHLVLTLLLPLLLTLLLTFLLHLSLHLSLPLVRVVQLLGPSVEALWWAASAGTGLEAASALRLGAGLLLLTLAPTPTPTLTPTPTAILPPTPTLTQTLTPNLNQARACCAACTGCTPVAGRTTTSSPPTSAWGLAPRRCGGWPGLARVAKP